MIYLKLLLYRIRKKISGLKRSKREQEKKNIENSIKKVMSRTGWQMDYAREQLENAQKRIGCTPKEYVMYKLYERTEEEQETFYLIAHQQPLHVKYAASKKFVRLIRDKEQTNHFFEEYVRRPWCVNTEVSLEEFKNTFKNSTKIIYKPADGHCGYGIEQFEITTENIEIIYEKLKNYSKGVVEEYIVQHPLMNSLNPNSVNSLRFVTISSNRKSVGKEGNKAEIVYAIVRIGQGNSIVDNLHSGGMVANVNLETGILETHGANHKNQVFVTHPDTGAIIKGFQVPFFKEAMEMVKDAIEKKRVEGYLGWDIAIGENGPMLLEVNNRPGADGLQTAYAQEGVGMKHIMEKYM